MIMPAATRVLVIYKKSTLELLSQHRRTSVQQRLPFATAIADQLQASHDAHQRTLEATRNALRQLGVKATFRHRLEPQNDAEADLVVTVGGDGTLLWASHLVSSQTPMLAVNSSPQSSVGYFCATDVHGLLPTLSAALRHELPSQQLARLQVSCDGEVLTRRVLNDILICHQSPAATSRYVLRWRGEEEEQKSSGLWVGPAAGSTAAQHSAGGEVLPLDSQHLQFVVREPYVPPHAAYGCVRGLIAPGEELCLQSWMDAGRLYVDGCRRIHVIELGAELRMRLSDETLTLLGMRQAVRTTANANH